MSVFFSVDGITGVDSVDSFGTYKGFDVLNVRHNMRERISEAFQRRGAFIDSGTSSRTFDDHAGHAIPVRSFQWSAFDRPTCVAIRAFLDGRKGRLVPFWVPTFCHDLVLSAAASSAALDLFIQKAGYLDLVFPNLSRQYVAIFPPGGTMVIRKITACVVNDAVSEKITIDSSAGVACPAGPATTISFLTFCRLAEDFTDIQWSSVAIAEAAIKFVELPLEVPA